MGYEVVEARLIGRVSRHNSPRDTQDVKRWNEFVEELQGLQTRFQDLDLDLMAEQLELPSYGE